MTSLSYLHTHRLYGAINSYEVEGCARCSWSGFVTPEWKESKDLPLNTPRIWFKIKQIFLVQSCCCAHTHRRSGEGVLSPAFCQRLGHVSCSFCADCCQHTVLALTGGPMVELCSSQPLLYTHTHTSHSLSPFTTT